VIDMSTRSRPGANDGGETLLELMIAAAIMGIVVVAIVGGIATSIMMSDIHRKQATAGAYVRNYAETVVAYVASGTPASKANFLAGSSPDYSPSTVGFTVPAGGFIASVTSVRCWDDANGKFISSCATASAVQQVTLNIASSDSRVSETLLVIVRRP
jgi:type II secretory pathway component PulJ